MNERRGLHRRERYAVRDDAVARKTDLNIKKAAGLPTKLLTLDISDSENHQSKRKR